MHKNVVLLAETGSDLTHEMAEKYGVWLVPMHVSMDGETYDDGTFLAEKVCAYYERTGKVPQTSASMPVDFAPVFDEIHAKYPDKKILHLAYSAVTTCSYQNAILAAEGRDYVISVDTRHVSVGQGAVVIETARMLEQNPDITAEEAAAKVREIADKTEMCFIPNNLDYLRAGGRVSNVVALTGNLLGLHPCIEIVDGKLMASKKYRGSFDKVIPRLLSDFDSNHGLDRDHLYFIWAPGLSDEHKALAEKTAREMGFRSFTWVKTGCVITCHGGAGAFGIVGKVN